MDNLMKPGNTSDELEQFQQEATTILEEEKFPVHKWESNVHTLESEDMPNPGKILEMTWNKQEDTIKVQVSARDDGQPVTRKSI